MVRLHRRIALVVMFGLNGGVGVGFMLRAVIAMRLPMPGNVLNNLARLIDDRRLWRRGLGIFVFARLSDRVRPCGGSGYQGACGQAQRYGTTSGHEKNPRYCGEEWSPAR